jgi:hypothetical protein
MQSAKVPMVERVAQTLSHAPTEVDGAKGGYTRCLDVGRRGRQLVG